MQSCDAIVIGAGFNGLAAAGRLAKAGRKVVVVEFSSQVGGGAETREFHPGYKVSGLAHILNQLDPRVERELDLKRHGLAFAAADLPSTALSPAGDHLVVSAKGECQLSGPDQQNWSALLERLTRYAAVLRPFKDMPPPRLAQSVDNKLWKLASTALSIRRMGQQDLRELLRLVLINIADVLNDELEDERLKGLIAFDTTLGSHLGPRSPNSLLLLLHRLSGSPLALAKGGMGAAAEALRQAVQSLGVEIKTSAQVATIRIDNDKVTGVELQSGQDISAPIVLSAINPRTTFLNLVGTPQLDTDFVRRISNVRMRGSAFKMNVALNGVPDFKGADLRSRLVIAPSVNAVENAFNAVKYGEFSAQPVMEIIVPSAFEPGFAPIGHHVLSIVAQYAPTELKGGWKQGCRKLEKLMFDTLETYAPGIRKLIVATELLTPPDIEQRYGLVGGNWHHGELAVEQMLFLRPTAQTAQYSTPITGLYLGSAGSHPGGGISGAAGWNAANRIVAEGRG